MTLVQRIDILAEHMRHEPQKEYPFTIEIDEVHGDAYAVFVDGFDRMEWDVRYPMFFDGYSIVDFESFESAYYLGRLN